MKKLTRLSKKALSMFDIKLIDSLIISDSDYYSFVDNGLI